MLLLLFYLLKGTFKSVVIAITSIGFPAIVLFYAVAVRFLFVHHRRLIYLPKPEKDSGVTGKTETWARETSGSLEAQTKPRS